ncbi:MAG: hypothetical protein HYV97_16785 [Bdellovibrio sp.]|nr:hypothetical protein [Bdellovibrio sp.]
MNIDSAKSLWKFDTIAQNEALINELKGALFEYLVAEELSHFDHPPCSCKIAPELSDRLLLYESWLRNHDLGLIVFMPTVAGQVARAIREYLPEHLKEIEVVGKIAGASGQKDLHESDLVVHARNHQGQEQDFFIGLKFCKASSFVNTKSGGGQTFLARYFGVFPESTRYQQEFNADLERAYLMMGQKLYDESGLGAQGYDFKGHFGPEWLEAGYPELPGQLPAKMHESVLQYYQMAIHSLYDKIVRLAKTAPQLFTDSLYPIVGFGARNLIQAIVFVDAKQVEGKKQYSLNNFKIHTQKDVMAEFDDMQMVPLRQEISSFEILLKSWRLQIRMKPMNKFTVPGLKVNCSVKYAAN